MYYRYKVKKKKFGLTKIIIILVLFAGIFYTAGRYKNYLLFWKYSYSKIDSKILEAESEKDITLKKEKLKNLIPVLARYRDDNQTNADLFLSSGKVYSILGEVGLNGSFSDLVINDRSDDTPISARNEFLKAIKLIYKGEALLDGKKMVSDYYLFLAKSCYYTNFKTINEIYSILEKEVKPYDLSSVEDLRFFSYMMILAGKGDDGLKLLTEHGKTGENLKGKFYLAASERTAKKYTSAINNYKAILTMTKEKNELKLANYDLGKIYSAQSLFGEALLHFIAASEIDPSDLDIKIWLGKSYFSLGDVIKAKAIFNEVIALDAANAEAKKLLSML
jgi:tetratricopeptide (TPR) repeat protein